MNCQRTEDGGGCSRRVLRTVAEMRTEAVQLSQNGQINQEEDIHASLQGIQRRDFGAALVSNDSWMKVVLFGCVTRRSPAERSPSGRISWNLWD